MRSTARWFALLLLASFVTASLRTTAAPVLPGGGPKVPDELLSLADVKAIRLDAGPLPRRLLGIGADTEAYRQVIRKALKESGFEISEDEDAPMLVSRVLVNEDPEHPGTIAIQHVIALRQRVVVDRLDRRLVVPTASVSIVTLASHDNAAAKLDSAVRRNLRTFQLMVNRATNAGRH
ncbi:MAG: hypothetical protein CMJ18_25250 [Phycisphaeraceae bacterium]|nr:hypothetical protein [Phycisphaeraceae bacterium]